MFLAACASWITWFYGRPENQHAIYALILFSHLMKLRDVAWDMLVQEKGWFTSWIAGVFIVHPKCSAQIEMWWFRYEEIFCYGVSIFSHQYAGRKNHIRMSTDWLKSVTTFDFKNCRLNYWFVFHRNKFSNEFSFGNRTDFPAVSETTLKVPLPF